MAACARGAKKCAGAAPDAAYCDLSEEGGCRVGYAIGLTSSSLSVSRHILQWASRFTRKLVESSLGGRVYASGEMVGHVALLRESFAPLLDISPGMVGMEACGSLFFSLGE